MGVPDEDVPTTEGKEDLSAIARRRAYGGEATANFEVERLVFSGAKLWSGVEEVRNEY